MSYITVDLPLDGGWIRVHQSSVRTNQKLAEDLQINAVVNPPNPDARTVFGVITWKSNGTPVQGAVVKVRDNDFGVGAEPMGQATTGADGKYRVRYAPGHWDPVPHQSGKWRPDIFVEVHLQDANGDWKEVWSSQVFTDHKLSEPLEISHAVNPPPQPTAPPTPPAPPGGTAGSVIRLSNRASETRYIYIDSAYHATLLRNEEGWISQD